MTIRKGIEPGDILWKESKPISEYAYNRESGRHERMNRTAYYVVRLQTRRARSQGDRVNPSLFPFLDSIRVRMIGHRQHLTEQVLSYTAVGTRYQRIMDKEEWDAMEINEVAQKWYQKIKNHSLVPLLEDKQDSFSPDFVKELKELVEEEDTEPEESGDWPPEPELRTHPMEVRQGYYYYASSW